MLRKKKWSQVLKQALTYTLGPCVRLGALVSGLLPGKSASSDQRFTLNYAPFYGGFDTWFLVPSEDRC